MVKTSQQRPQRNKNFDLGESGNNLTRSGSENWRRWLRRRTYRGEPGGCSEQ